MKYVISTRGLGNYPELEIKKENYDQLKMARLCLSAAMALEEKYELLISNYIDLEKECLNVSTEYMVRRSSGYTDFFDIRLLFNKRIVNLLTSTRLYIDQIQQHVKTCLPNDPGIEIAVKSLLSAEYDQSFEYRFMEAIRNYVQHRGLAVHSTSRHQGWDSHEENAELEYKTRLFTDKSEVESDKAFKKQVSNEMPEQVDLIYASRVYIESISKVHCKIRDLISNVTEESRNQIDKFRNKYADISEGKQVGIYAICYISKDKNAGIVEKYPLILEWDNIRLELIRKNTNLINLRKRHVSSSIKYKNNKK